MKIIIFGSTGGTGQQLVSQALGMEYSVTAFARSPKKINLEHKNLKVVKGDVLNPSSVEKAIKGHDVVFCALGMSNILDKSQLRAKGTNNIIQAMEKNGIKRFICQSSLGADSSHEILPLRYKYFIAPLFMRHLYEDHNAQEMLIKQSQLEWTIVRPGVLTNGTCTNRYKHGLTPSDKPVSIQAKISRADTAHFMLRQLTDMKYLYKSPFISN